jgi:hypothetical protein
MPMFLPDCSFSAWSWPVTSPEMNEVFFQSELVSVFETTSLGVSLMYAANGSLGSALGQ